MKNGITKPKILRKPKNKSIKIINGLKIQVNGMYSVHRSGKKRKIY